MRYTKTLPINISVLSPRSMVRDDLVSHIKHHELEVSYFESMSTLLTSIKQQQPNLILVHCPADAVLKSTKTFAPILSHPLIPVVLIHDIITAAMGIRLLEASFADFISLKNLTQEALLRSFRLLTQAQHKESEIRNLKGTDPLTNVFHRNKFYQIFQQTQESIEQSGGALALFSIDIDDFDAINQRIGCIAGDQIIKDFCNRLLLCAHTSPVFRMGGDEFTIILQSSSAETIKDQVNAFLERMVSILHKAFTVDEDDVVLGTSIGVTLSSEKEINTDDLVGQASQARKRAKRMHGCSFSIYEAEEDLAPPYQGLLEPDLWTALKQEQFELYYQPRIDLRTGHIVGAEALMRWHHPEHGLIMPSDFIPVSEHTGQIVPMGFWAVQQAGKDLKMMKSAGYGLSKLGVNLSFRQFQSDTLAQTIKRIVVAEKIDTSILEFELTESSLFSDDHHVKHSVEQLSKIGIDFSLDDFGTGYSSFTVLQKLPISALKIDRSFVAKVTSSPNDAEIVRAVISLAHNLNLGVIAEGVETKAQLEFLIKNNCDQVQGFFFSQPVPLGQFMKMLKAS